MTQKIPYEIFQMLFIDDGTINFTMTEILEFPVNMQCKGGSNIAYGQKRISETRGNSDAY